MPESGIPDGFIPALAKLYDRFANSFDLANPDSGRDLAEQTFKDEVSKWYDFLHGPKPEFNEFRKGVISRCKKHLKAPQNQ